jgi:hypothetical protein
MVDATNDFTGLPSFGTKYQARKAELVELAKQGLVSDIAVEAEQVIIMGKPINIVCYFCLDKISGPMHLLEDISDAAGKHTQINRYYVHDACYHQARDNPD